MKPLAEIMRPKKIEDIVGQKEILGKNSMLKKLYENGNLVNMIFFGPPGVGKTTLAEILCEKSNKKLVKMNCTIVGAKEIQGIEKELNTFEGSNGIVLYLDEIHALSKAGQNMLLSFVEKGEIILIASTTKNPYFSIDKAILSRCLIFKFTDVSSEDIEKCIKKAISKIENDSLQIEYEEKALAKISDMAKGDVRRALNIIDFLIKANPFGKIKIDMECIKEISNESINKGENDYYNWISMLHKSIRGSDPDASLAALAMLLEMGYFEEVIRRLLVIASEDCGLALGSMYSSVSGLATSAHMVGMPEARIILSHLVLLLATSPKSNSAYLGIDKAYEDIKNINVGDVQEYLKDAHYIGATRLGIKGYKNPHNYKNHYIEQEYMPTKLVGKQYYVPGNNKYEKGIKEYWNKVKK